MGRGRGRSLTLLCVIALSASACNLLQGADEEPAPVVAETPSEPAPEPTPTPTPSPTPEPVAVDPCAPPEPGKDGWTATAVAADLATQPRKVACTGDRVLVHARAGDGTLAFGPDGAERQGLGAVGQPAGSTDLAVMHTFGSVHVREPGDRVLTEVPGAWDGQDHYVMHAVPVGDRVLVATNLRTSLLEVDGTEVWGRDESGPATIVQDAGQNWVASADGTFTRIDRDGVVTGPIGGSDLAFPDLRRAPFVPVGDQGGWAAGPGEDLVWVGEGNPCDTDRIPIGANFRGDGVHTVQERTLRHLGGSLWVDGPDGITQLDLADCLPVRADERGMPFTEGAGCLWFAVDGMVVAFDLETGEERLRVSAPYGGWHEWAHGALWVTTQGDGRTGGGEVWRIGPPG